MRETKKLATRDDLARVAALGDEPLEAADVGLGDLFVALQREDQRDVDRAPLAITSSIAARPGFVAGILTIRFGRSTTLVQAIASRNVSSVS